MLRTSLTLLLVFLLAACAGSSPRTNFYALEAGPAPRSVAKLPELSLVLGPILLPDTLDRPQIVTRGEPHARELAEFHRWAGNLKADMGRQLARRLMAALGTERVFQSSSTRYRDLDYQIRLDILVFEGRLGGKVELIGFWVLLDKEGNEVLHLQGFDLSETAAGKGYLDLVAAQSHLVARLGDLIAAGVKSMVVQAKPRGAE